ncbi:MAG: hypothetical protein NC924_04810 [Candidatus Omnitrophica bacterium]|nr:hypothetical protein [Candidatus Omnitrophota bacterium]
MMERDAMNASRRALERIDSQLAEFEPGSLRYEILTCVRKFKSSWMELGQYLVSVHRDKLYKEWDYLTFDAYCVKEVGIRKETAQKLLRSYFFLEQEEPEYLKKEYAEQADVRKIPSFEAVDTLRQVKNNKRLSEEAYTQMRQKVLEDGGADKEVKDVYRQMMKNAQEAAADPEEERKKRRGQYVRRMLGALASLRRELEANNFLSGKILKDLDVVINEIEEELV